MPATLAKMYDALSVSLQQEVLDFVTSLYEKNVAKPERKSARGIAAKYANAALIEKEKTAMEMAFSGDNV